jgi:hypothetical protein
VPQAVPVAPGVMQVLLWQQPIGQLVASQVQTPLRQCWPMSHTTQTPPLAPKWASEACRQASPLQQPLGQLCGVQAQRPFTHAWPVPQAVHVPPAAPHAASDVPG